MHPKTIANLPPGFFDWYKKYFGFSGKAEEVYAHMEQFVDCWKASQQAAPAAKDWTVFNSGGAVVAEGRPFEDAIDYLTDERLERGWTAVCVVNKDNPPLLT